MEGHVLTYSPSLKRMEKVMETYENGKSLKDKMSETVYNVVTWIREQETRLMVIVGPRMEDKLPNNVP